MGPQYTHFLCSTTPKFLLLLVYHEGINGHVSHNHYWYTIIHTHTHTPNRPPLPSYSTNTLYSTYIPSYLKSSVYHASCCIICISMKNVLNQKWNSFSWRSEGEREGDNNVLVSVVHGDRVLGCRLWEIIFLEEATLSNPCILHCMYQSKYMCVYTSYNYSVSLLI